MRYILYVMSASHLKTGAENNLVTANGEGQRRQQGRQDPFDGNKEAQQLSPKLDN